MKRLLLPILLLCISGHGNAMKAGTLENSSDVFQQELSNESLQLDKKDLVAILSRSNPATLLAYLCDKIPKEEAKARADQILSTNPESIHTSSAIGLAEICREYDQQPARRPMILRECFIECWPRSGDGERAGCAYLNPTPLDIIQRKITNGCKAESCLYVYQQFKESEEKRRKQKAEQAEEEKQKRKKILETEHTQIVDRFKANSPLPKK